MITKRLGSFKLSVGGYVALDTPIPGSVVSSLIKNKILPHIYHGEGVALAEGIARDGASFSAEFEVDAMLVGMESLILRLGEMSDNSVLFINGSPVLRVASGGFVRNIDIKRYVRIGKNTVELVFDPREDRGVVEDIGMYSAPELLFFNGCVIDTVAVDTRYTEGGAALDVSVGYLGSGADIRAVATLVSPGGSVSYSSLADGRGTLSISSPNNWMPVGLGLQSLYRLSINIYSGSELCDSREVRVGLRRVRLLEDKLYLGDREFLPCAAIYDTDGSARALESDEKLAHILGRAARAGVNMLYVTSNDGYPKDAFLSRCDEIGMALAIKLGEIPVPNSPAEKKVFEKELRSMLLRFAAHPSVIMLFGMKAAEDAVREAIRSILPGVIYLSDFSVSDGDFIPALPTLSTSLEYLAEEDRNIFSPAVELKAPRGISRLAEAVAGGYRMPHSFLEWTYLSSLVSADEIEREAFLERLGRRPPSCALTYIWEPMPGLTPSLLDYSGKPKAAYYSMLRISRPAAIYTELDGTRVKFYASNLQTDVYTGKLTYKVCDMKNTELLSECVDFSVDGGKSELIFECELSDAVSGKERSCYLSYYAADRRGIHSRGCRFFTESRFLNLEKPSIKVDIAGTGCEYMLTVSSDVFVAMLSIDFVGSEDVVLEDNFFSITSNKPIRLWLKTTRPTAVESLRKELRLASLFDVGRY